MKKILIVIAALLIPSLGIGAQQNLNYSTRTNWATEGAKVQANFTEVYSTKADKTATGMRWDVWPDGSSFTVSSPPVWYEGTWYECIASYSKSSGDTPNNLPASFAPMNTGSQMASDLLFSPYGSISSTNVQAAIQELSDEKVDEAQVIIKGGGTSYTPSAATDPTNKAYVDAQVVASGGYNNEAAQDAIATLFAAGTHSGISYAYDDANGSFNSSLDLTYLNARYQLSDTDLSLIAALPTTATGRSLLTTDTLANLRTAMGAEPSLGTPSSNGMVLTKSTSGAVSWISPSGMSYPSGGVVTSTGTAWGPSLIVGTGANNLVQLNSAGAYPSANGANITNLTPANIQGAGAAAASTYLGKDGTGTMGFYALPSGSGVNTGNAYTWTGQQTFQNIVLPYFSTTAYSLQSSEPTCSAGQYFTYAYGSGWRSCYNGTRGNLGGSTSIAAITDWPAGVVAAEVGYLDGVTSAVQTQLNAKVNLIDIDSQAEFESTLGWSLPGGGGTLTITESATDPVISSMNTGDIIVSRASGDMFYKSGTGHYVFTGTYTAGAPAPVLNSATVASNGTTLTLGADQSLSVGAGGNAGFNLDCTASGQNINATYSSGIPGASPVFTLASTVSQSDTCNLDYTQPGNGFEATDDATDLSSINNMVVTNNSTQAGGASINDNFSTNTLANYSIIFQDVAGPTYDGTNFRLAGESNVYWSTTVYHETALSSADQHVVEKLVVGTGSRSGLIFRCDGNGSASVGWDVYPDTNALYLETFVGGTTTYYATLSYPGGKTWADTNVSHKVKVSVSGTTLSAYVDWNDDGDFADTDETITTTQTITATPTGNYVGAMLEQNGAAVWIDDLEAGTP